MKCIWEIIPASESNKSFVNGMDYVILNCWNFFMSSKFCYLITLGKMVYICWNSKRKKIGLIISFAIILD